MIRRTMRALGLALLPMVLVLTSTGPVAATTYPLNWAYTGLACAGHGYGYYGHGYVKGNAWMNERGTSGVSKLRIQFQAQYYEGAWYNATGSGGSHRYESAWFYDNSANHSLGYKSFRADFPGSFHPDRVRLRIKYTWLDWYSGVVYSKTIYSASCRT